MIPMPSMIRAVRWKFWALKIMNPSPWAPTSISAAMSARQP